LRNIARIESSPEPFSELIGTTSNTAILRDRRSPVIDLGPLDIWPADSLINRLWGRRTLITSEEEWTDDELDQARDELEHPR